MSPSEGLDELLAELEGILDAERQALRRLDVEAISHAADEKLRLDEALRLAPKASHTLALQNRLQRIQRTARVNQILLAHARSCVQGMLQLLTGQEQMPIARAGTAPPPPVAVNFRG